MALITSALASTVAYGLPKIAGYLCKRPEDVSHTRLERIRERFAALQEKTELVVGQKMWFVLTEVISDNAWVSLLVLNYLRSTVVGPLEIEQTLAYATGLVAFGGLSWMTRYGLTKACPAVGKYIGTKSLH